MPLLKISEEEKRTAEQLRRHYEIEKELANRLRNADKEKRKKLYSAVYDELYKKIPDHPQLIRKSNPEIRRQTIVSRIKFLLNFLNKEKTFLEIGSGDCQLCFEAAKYVKKVFAVDVSKEIADNAQPPENFELIISDDGSVNLPPGSIDVVYSNNVVEHLHPDDFVEQLKGTYNVLVFGGRYICFTPHRFSGPHDVSKYFDKTATGLHLKEYTNRELYRLFKSAGFSKVQSCIGGKGRYIKFPICLVMLMERLMEVIPYLLRRKIAKTIGLKTFLGIRLIATK